MGVYVCRRATPWTSASSTFTTASPTAASTAATSSTAWRRSPDRARRRWRCCRCCRTITRAPRWLRPTMRGSAIERVVLRFAQGQRSTAISPGSKPRESARSSSSSMKTAGSIRIIEDVARRIRARRLSRLRRRFAVAGRRHAGRRRRGARPAPARLNARRRRRGARGRRCRSSSSIAESTGKVGAVGFCFGGGMVNRLAAAAPGTRRRRRLLRPSGAGRRRCPTIQARAVAALCRARRRA